MRPFQAWIARLRLPPIQRKNWVRALISFERTLLEEISNEGSEDPLDEKVSRSTTIWYKQRNLPRRKTLKMKKKHVIQNSPKEDTNVGTIYKAHPHVILFGDKGKGGWIMLRSKRKKGNHKNALGSHSFDPIETIKKTTKKKKLTKPKRSTCNSQMIWEIQKN